MTPITINFSKMSNNVYKIYVSKEEIGLINIKDNQNIINIDIEGYYFHLIKNRLMNDFLKQLGRKNIFLLSNKIYQEYYEELGFKIVSNQVKNNDRVLLKYAIL